jgi:hypothetical protein
MSDGNVKEVVSKIRTLPPDRLMPPMAPEYHSAFNHFPKKQTSTVKIPEMNVSPLESLVSTSPRSTEQAERNEERKNYEILVAELNGAKSENESLKAKLEFIWTLLTPLQHKQLDATSVDTGHNDSNVSSLTIAVLMDDPIQLENQVNDCLRRLKSIRKKETELRRKVSNNQPKRQFPTKTEPDEDIEAELFQLACEEREERKTLAHASDKLRRLKTKGGLQSALNTSMTTTTKEHRGSVITDSVSSPKVYWPRRAGLKTSGINNSKTNPDSTQRHEKSEKVRRETTFRRVVLRAVNARLLMGFLCWKDHVATIIRHERIVNRALKTMQNQTNSLQLDIVGIQNDRIKHNLDAITIHTILAENEAIREAHVTELKNLKKIKESAEKAHREVILRRVVLRAQNSKQLIGFLCWKDHVATIIRHERIVNRALKTMQNRSLSRSFRQWVSMLESARQERAAAAAASLLAEKEAMRAAHEAELAASKAAAEKARRESIFRRVVLRAVNVRLSMGFLCWKDHVATIIRHERIVNRALKTMQNRSLSRSFRQWVSMLESARQERAAAAAASLLAEKEAMRAAHEAELAASKAAAEKARRESIFRRVVLRAVNVRLSMGFLCWKDHVATIIRHERIVNRALKTMQNRSLSRSFRQWVSMLESARQERAAAAAASLLAEKEAMRAAHEAELAASKAAAEKARRESIFRRVVLRAVNVRLSMGFLCWKDHVATIIRHERIVNRALKTMQNRSLSRSFRQWVSMLESARIRTVSSSF